MAGDHLHKLYRYHQEPVPFRLLVRFVSYCASDTFHSWTHRSVGIRSWITPDYCTFDAPARYLGVGIVFLQYSELGAMPCSTRARLCEGPLYFGWLIKELHT